jgi:exosortase A-associated hydrolase 2
MNEQPFFFVNDGAELFGILHLPEERPVSGFVFCCPFAEEKLWAHRVFVNFARELCGRGHAVLRFDYRGHGDSEGDFENATVASRLSDIARALRLIREEAASIEAVSLLGLRFGATLAALAAERAPDISRLILWEPLVSGPDYLQELLRTNLATQMAILKKIEFNRKTLTNMLAQGETVHVEGYGLTKELYDQMSAIDLLAGAKQFQGPTRIVQIDPYKGVLTKPLQTLQSLYGNSTLVHASEQLFWKEINPYYPRADVLYEKTLEWLEPPITAVSDRAGGPVPPR